MISVLPAILTALGLGVATSVSPCPLATNVAAVMFVTRDINRPGKILAGGAAYAIGRATLYMILGLLVGGTLVSISSLSLWLQDNMIKILGPILIVAGLFILEWINMPGWSNDRLENIARAIGDKGGVFGSFGVGVVFALAFCPVTAAIFVGSLLPLEIDSGSYIAVPLAYGLGSALPVLIFALAAAFFSRGFNKLLGGANVFGRWMKNLAGVTILVIGLYFSVVYVWLM